MALLDFETNLALGQDGNTDAQSVDPFRNLLDSISGGALQPKPLVFNGAPSADPNYVLTRVKNGSGAGGIDLALMSATAPLGGSDADQLNFTHEFGMEVAEYLAWWYEASPYRTLGNSNLNAADRETVLIALANDMKAKYNTHIASAVHHSIPDGVNVVTQTPITNLAEVILAFNEMKAKFNLHRTQATVHVLNDTFNVVTAADAVDLATAVTLAADITTMYFDHSLNQLEKGFHTIPDTLNQFAKGGGFMFNAWLAPSGIIQFPLVIRAAESGGWFKEALSLKTMRDGKYKTGEQMSFRAFGTHLRAMNLAFPNILTPSPTAGVTELSEIFSGKYNGGEFNEPVGDACPTAPSVGLFPNWPNKGGSIIDAFDGKAHYYIGSYHTPFRHRCLLVNKSWFEGLASEQDRDWIRAAVYACAMRNVTHSQTLGDDIIDTWQDVGGAVIHRAMPRDILDRMRTALSDAQENKAATDAKYAIMLDSQRTFMKENAVRWGSLPNRQYRVARTDYETDLKVDRP